MFTLNTLCSQFAPAVDKIVYESAASKQHELIHTQSLWITRSYLVVFGLVIVMKASYTHCHYNHAHTTIQSYTYNHAMVLHAGK